MWRILLSIIVLMLSFTNFAQTSFILTDEATSLPILQAKLVLTEGNTKQIAITDDNGAIRFNNLKHNNYTYSATAIGYDTLTGNYNYKGENKNIYLKLSKSIIFDAVVVTAQYEPTLVNNAIQKISIITADQIEQSGAVNLADILTYQTGIRISQDNILGSAMSLGGLSGQNVKILIDGVPVIGRQDGNIDLSQINLANIARIEIIEGPLSVNYGTNALAGTINLITKSSSQNGFTASVSPYYESIGNYNLTTNINAGLNGNAFSVAAGRNYFNGWTANQEFNLIPQPNTADSSRVKTWKPKEQYFVDINYYKRWKGFTFSPYVRYFNELIINRGNPLAPYNEFGLDDFYATERKDAGITFSKRFTRSNINAIAAFNHFQRTKNTFVKNLTDLSRELSQASGAQDTSQFTLANIRTTFAYRFKENFTLETGIDINYETATGERIETGFRTQGDYALYTTANWRILKKLKIKPGIRVAYNSNYQAPVTPSINLLYEHKKLKFRGAFARGFRAPTLKELYFDFVDINHNIQGNEALKSEFSYNYSAGINWSNLVKNKLLLVADYTAFYNDIKNLITLGQLDDQTFTYINLGRFKTFGNQLKFSIKQNRLNATIASSYIGRYNNLNNSFDAIKPFTFSPESSLTLSYELIKNKFQVNAFYKYNGALQSYRLIEDEIYINIQSAYSILDLSSSLKLFKQNLRITLGVKNVLNVQTVNVIGTADSGGAHSGGGSFNAATGTSVFLQLNYKFHHDFKKK